MTLEEIQYEAEQEQLSDIKEKELREDMSDDEYYFYITRERID